MLFQLGYALRNVDRFSGFGYTIGINILDVPLGHFSPLCQKVEDVFVSSGVKDIAISEYFLHILGVVQRKSRVYIVV